MFGLQLPNRGVFQPFPSTTLKYHSIPHGKLWPQLSRTWWTCPSHLSDWIGFVVWFPLWVGLFLSFFPGEILSFVGYIHVLHGWLNLHFSWFDPPKPCRFHGGAAGKRSRSGGAAMVRPRNFRWLQIGRRIYWADGVKSQFFCWGISKKWELGKVFFWISKIWNIFFLGGTWAVFSNNLNWSLMAFVIRICEELL